MDQQDDVYKGPIPIPSTGQSIKEFEAEELSKDQYTEFSSVDDIMGRPEYFANIISHANFQNMVYGKEEIKDAGAASGPSESPKPATPASALDVAPIVLTDAPADSPPPIVEVAPQKTGFKPRYSFKKLPLSGSKGLSTTASLSVVTGSDVDDIQPFFGSVESSSALRAIHRFDERFIGAGIIDTSLIDGDGVHCSMDVHAYRVSAEESDVARRIEYEQSSQVQSTRRPVPVTYNAHDLTNENGTCFDLSGVGMTGLQAVPSAEVVVSPYRTRLLYSHLLAFRYIFQTSRELFSGADPTLAALATENTVSRDTVSPQSVDVTLYPRHELSLSEQYLRHLLSARGDHVISTVSRSLFDHSLSVAKTYFHSLEPGSAILHADDPRAAPLKNMLSTVPQSSGAVFLESMGGLLLGGRLRKADMNLEDVSSMHELRRGLCAVATLSMVPYKCLPSDVYIQLFGMILSPFYSISSFPAVNIAGARVVRDGVIGIIQDFLANPAAPLPSPTRLSNFSATGAQSLRFVRNALLALMRNLLNTTLERVGRPRSMFKHPLGGEVLTLSAPTYDTPDILIHGTSAGDVSSHEYSRRAEMVRSNLKTFLDCASQAKRYQFYGSYFEGLNLSAPDNLAKGFGVFNALLSKGLVDHDCYSVTPLWADSPMLAPVSIPFEGALSLALYGASSSEVIMKGDTFRYTDAVNLSLPSLYPAYVYLEACVARQAVLNLQRTAYGRVIRNRHMEDVYKVCEKQMERWFTSLDPDSPKRFRELIRISMIPEEDLTTGERDVHDLFMGYGMMPVQFIPGTAAGRNIDVPNLSSSRKSDDGWIFKTVEASPTVAVQDCFEKRVTDIFIPLYPVRPIQVVTPNSRGKAGSIAYVYDNDVDADMSATLDIDRLLESSVATLLTEFSAPLIRKMLDWYNRTYNASMRFVRIPCRTQFSLRGEKLSPNGYYAGPDIALKPFDQGRANRTDVKFEVGKVEVACVEVPNIIRKDEWFGSYGTYDSHVLISKTDFIRGLAYFDSGIDLSDTSVVRLTDDKDQYASHPAVRSGNGAMLGTLAHVSIPKVEKYTFPDVLTRTRGMLMN